MTQVKKLLALMAVWSALACPAGADAPQANAARASSENMVVTFLDCGQGDAIVIRTPGGKIYLIDGGPNERAHGGNLDAGEDVIVPFLESRKVKVVDGIVVSHPHLDHYGGIPAVMDRFTVREFIDSGWPTKSPPYLQVLKRVEQKKMIYRVVKEGNTLNWDPKLKVEVFGPSDEPYADNPDKENPNNRSVVLKVTYNKVAFFFSGDAELEAEDHLVRTFGKRLESHIMKAPHHASKTSSMEEFLDALNPELVVISCGRRNRFGHPNPTVLDRFKQRGLKYFRTDQDGTVQVITDGKRYSVKKFGVGNTPGATR